MLSASKSNAGGISTGGGVVAPTSLSSFTDDALLSFASSWTLPLGVGLVTSMALLSVAALASSSSVAAGGVSFWAGGADSDVAVSFTAAAPSEGDGASAFSSTAGSTCFAFSAVSALRAPSTIVGPPKASISSHCSIQFRILSRSASLVPAQSRTDAMASTTTVSPSCDRRSASRSHFLSFWYPACSGDSEMRTSCATLR
mmetsp:Transcript_2541/g.7456  ORF Transcript_2541/g.7456 Transcript_2541/m.7456 type:complete len:200 (+) Transcript_2541:682-1281(+)